MSEKDFRGLLSCCRETPSLRTWEIALNHLTVVLCLGKCSFWLSWRVENTLLVVKNRFSAFFFQSVDSILLFLLWMIIWLYDFVFTRVISDFKALACTPRDHSIARLLLLLHGTIWRPCKKPTKKKTKTKWLWIWVCWNSIFSKHRLCLLI